MLLTDESLKYFEGEEKISHSSSVHRKKRENIFSFWLMQKITAVFYITKLQFSRMFHVI